MITKNRSHDDTKSLKNFVSFVAKFLVAFVA